MNDRRQQYRQAFAFGLFGVLGLTLFLVVAGITTRARVRDVDFPLLHRRADVRVVGYGQVRGGPVVGGPGGGGARGAADLGAGGGGEVGHRANLASEVIENKGEVQ